MSTSTNMGTSPNMGRNTNMSSHRFVIPVLVVGLALSLVAADSPTSTIPPLVMTTGEHQPQNPKPPAGRKAAGAKDAGAKAAGLRIGVLDVALATRAHPHAKQKQDQAKEWRRRQWASLQELDKELETKTRKLASEAQISGRGAPAVSALAMEVELLKTRYRVEDQRLEQGYRRLRSETILTLRNQVQDAAVKLASRRGLDLVLRKVTADAKAPLLERMRANEAQTVVYARKTMDITEDVIDYMKTLYTK